MSLTVTGTHDHPSKILVLSHSYLRDKNDYAGLFVHSLNKALISRGYQITVISPHADGLDDREIMDGVEVNRFRYMPAALETLAYQGTMHEKVRNSWWNKFVFLSFITAFFLKTTAKILTDRPVVIHAHWWFPGGFIALVSSFMLRVPYIVTIHGTDAHIVESNILMTGLFRIVVKRSSAIVVGSGYLENLVTSLLPADEKHRPVITRIPPPVEIPSNAGTICKNEQEHVILSVARLTSQKNLGVLIEALKILDRKGVLFRAKIVGDGPLKENLLEQISQSGLDECVSILPGVGREDLFSLYSECSVFVLPSLREGLGLVIVEALLMKKAVIASSTGGGTEIIENGVTGLLFDPSKPVQLAETIRRLLEDSGLASQLAENGYRKAVAAFSPESISGRYSSLYQKLFA